MNENFLKDFPLSKASWAQSLKPGQRQSSVKMGNMKCIDEKMG